MLKKYLFILFTIAYSLLTILNAASVEATVNTQEVVKGNPVQLMIEASGGSAAFPNIREINGVGVTDSGTSTSTSMSMSASGMKRETKTTKRYIFVPQNDMTIPAYTVRVGSETLKTKPIKIKVTTSNAPTMKTNTTYSFVMKSSKDSMVVGESFVVTLYLSLADSLGVQQVSEYVEPKSDGFFFKDLGKQKQYKRGNVNVIEKQYSVTAKQEGNFTISAASAKVGVTDRHRQDLFGRYGIRWIDVISNGLTLEVKPLEMETDLVGEFMINSKIDKQKVKVNKPVNLTVSISGKGNLEDFVFPKYEIDGVTIYDDEAKIESHMEAGKLVSQYSKKFVFIAEDDFTIPKRVISVYNTSTQEVEVLEVPSYEVNIESKKLLNKMLPTLAETPSPDVQKKEIIKKEVKSVDWLMLVFAFILGMLMMYLLQFLPKIWQRNERSYKESDTLKILYAHISEDKEVEAMVRKLYAKKNGDKSVKIDKKELKAMVERFR